MQGDNTLLFREYMHMYEVAKPLSNFNMKKEDETWEIFKAKSGFPIKLLNTKKQMAELASDEYLLGKGNFYDKHKYIYIIPNVINGEIRSFILRGFKGSDYRDYNGLITQKPMFGFEDFADYKPKKPIIITEGVKDCLVLKQLYPYTLALLGVGLTQKKLDILKSMTNKLIVAYDNDETGEKAFWKTQYTCRNLGIQVQKLEPKKKYGKDFGKSYQHIQEYQKELDKKLSLFTTISIGKLRK